MTEAQKRMRRNFPILFRQGIKVNKCNIYIYIYIYIYTYIMSLQEQNRIVLDFKLIEDNYFRTEVT